MTAALSVKCWLFLVSNHILQTLKYYYRILRYFKSAQKQIHVCVYKDQSYSMH